MKKKKDTEKTCCCEGTFPDFKVHTKNDCYTTFPIIPPTDDMQKAGL